jgi:hypothetical protein
VPSPTFWRQHETGDIALCFQHLRFKSRKNTRASLPLLTYPKRHKRETLFTLCGIGQCTGLHAYCSNLCN